MGHRTRASALAERVYSSPAAQKQLEFKPRQRTVKVRHSLGAPTPSRQETLTQMDFVNLQSSTFHDAEDDAPRRKRRRTDGDAETPSSTYHTQTLTQIDFVPSTPAVNFDDGDEENVYDALPGNARTSKAGEYEVMGPPKTPVRGRLYEVPSSQSPLTPLSNHSQRYLELRSPLTSVDINSRKRVFSPTYKGAVFKQSVLDVRDSFDVPEEVSQANGTPTPVSLSVATENAEKTLITKSTLFMKQEIQDSDEEYDDDFSYNDDAEGLQQAPVDVPKPEAEIKQETDNDEPVSDILNDEPIPETQIEELEDSAIPETQLEEIPIAKFEEDINTDTNMLHFQSDLTDTQEAEQQLNSTMLQFTQMHELNHEYTVISMAAPESEPDPGAEQEGNQKGERELPSGSYVGPSQATTVAESSPLPLCPLQPVRSTSVLRPNSADDETQDQDIDDIEDDEDDGLVTMIPDSPANARTQSYRRHGHSSSTTQSLPPLPFSLASSQLLTRSQMLPESLMNDSTPLPPSLPRELFLIEDSDLDE